MSRKKLSSAQATLACVTAILISIVISATIISVNGGNSGILSELLNKINF